MTMTNIVYLFLLLALGAGYSQDQLETGYANWPIRRSSRQKKSG